MVFAMMGATRMSLTPITLASGRPGFKRGPRKLKMVFIPSSFRTLATCRIEGWKVGANKKQKLDLSTILGTMGPGTFKNAPNCSNKSALPLLDVAERLPCFVTRIPAPAATIEAGVEMFQVFLPSPPVPTISAQLDMFKELLLSRMVRMNKPSTSSVIFAGGIIARKAAFWTSGRSGVKSCRIAARLSSSERSLLPFCCVAIHF
mmetsp:Transcript_90702/g.157227  ORF Transcript_90702/g.157227 Transcript_90702/m.157227 type:complete len:204 (+) Transcript_90702:3206-3817(+)